MNFNRVAVLRGGPCSEYDVSLKTGAGVLDALKELGYFTKDIQITRKGEWLWQGRAYDPQAALCDVDVVFLALHGAYGEDGTVQRIIERFNLPYTGSGPYASNLAMNKLLAKEEVIKLGIKMPKHLKVSKNDISNITKTVHGITQVLGERVIVKPINGGSSIDMFISKHSGELSSKLAEILEKYDQVMLEEYIVGREATVGVLEDFREQRLYVLPEIEIIPPSGKDYFSADVKYTGETEEVCPSRFDKETKQKLAEAARNIHQAINLSQYSRSDFIVSDGEIYFLEVNTLPGLTAESLYPKAMEAVGSNYKELVGHLVKTAKAR